MQPEDPSMTAAPICCGPTSFTAQPDLLQGSPGLAAEGILLPVEPHPKFRHSFGHGEGKSLWLTLDGVVGRMLPGGSALSPCTEWMFTL